MFAGAIPPCVSKRECRCESISVLRPGFFNTAIYCTCHGEETSWDLQRLQTFSTWDASARTFVRYQCFTLEWMARQRRPPRQQKQKHRQWQHLPASTIHNGVFTSDFVQCTLTNHFINDLAVKSADKFAVSCSIPKSTL